MVLSEPVSTIYMGAARWFFGTVDLPSRGRLFSAEFDNAAEEHNLDSCGGDYGCTC
jgi:hypothetical protein